MIKRIISTMIMIILIVGLLKSSGEIDNSTMSSEDSKIIESNFNNYFFENTSITSSDGVELILGEKYIRDDFYDKSKILDYKNITIDNVNNMIYLNMINRTFGGLDHDCGYSVINSPDGGYVITGFIEVSPMLNNCDVWLIKTDRGGNIQWHKTFGGEKDDRGYSVLNTSDGGYIIVGSTESYGWGESDIYLIKTDEFGTEQWNRTYGGSDWEWGTEVKQTTEGGYIIIGDTYSFGSGFIDIWMIKTDEFGKRQWDKTFGGSGLEYGASIHQNSDGSYILLGSTSSYGFGGHDLWLIKTNSLGHREWDKTFGDAQSDYGRSIQQTSDSGYIIIGDSYSYGSGNGDIWLIKIDSDGTKLWDKIYGYDDQDKGESVQQTDDNGYIITGYSVDKDVLLIKTDDLGNKIWDKSFGGSGSNRAYSVRQTLDQGYIIIGETTSYGSGWYDLWLIKTDKNGEINTNGYFQSNNLLNEQGINSINKFNITAYVPKDSTIEIQFSFDNITWYDSNGNLSESNILIKGLNSFDLQKLRWKYSDFYYRLYFETFNNYCSINKIELIYKKYPSNGYINSQKISYPTGISFKDIGWNATIPQGTDILFQLRSGKNDSSLLNAIFVGPDGQNDTYYNLSDTKVWIGHNNDEKLQYNVIFESEGQNTPILREVSIDYNYYPNQPININPISNAWINYSTPFFYWNFSDFDGYQSRFQIIIDNNITFSEIHFNRDDIDSFNTSWQFLNPIPDGIWYWKVKTMDNENDWSEYSNYSIIKIDTTPPDQFDSLMEPNSSWITYNQPKITFSTIDITSGISHYEVKVDNGSFSNQNSPYDLPSLDIGNHQITVRAYDIAQNYKDEIIDINITQEDEEKPDTDEDDESIIVTQKSNIILSIASIIIIIVLLLSYLWIIKKRKSLPEIDKNKKEESEKE